MRTIAAYHEQLFYYYVSLNFNLSGMPATPPRATYGMVNSIELLMEYQYINPHSSGAS
jgi:hypothetical protein